jgi:BirA family biotin operon repressor/biotin-[acetyl-CoA-carboxylase] ligase
VDSTSTRAEALAADPANDGVVVLAGEQTAGRGQYGRTWQCPGGAGVLLSVLLFPPPPLRRAPVLTAWAAVSVCELVEKVAGVEARIKWPNDVLIGGRKICGILIEQGVRGTVAGMGLNVNQPAEHFAAIGLPLATSLAIVTGEQRDSAAVAKELIATLDAQLGRLSGGDFDTLEACWQRHLGLLGKQVVAETASQTFRGRLRGVTFDGVELELSSGEMLRLLNAFGVQAQLWEELELSSGETLGLRPEAIRHLEGIPHLPT